MTPLYRADDVETVRVLLDAGAEVNVLSYAGMTPLLLKMRWQDDLKHLDKRDFPEWVSPRADVIALLLERGADPDLTENYRGSCVHQAAAAPGASNLERILPSSRNLLAKNRDGQTPIDVAREWGRALNVQRLEQELRGRGIPIPAAPEPSPAPPADEPANAQPHREKAAPERAGGGWLATLRRLFKPGSRP
jgi:ankyrin repeat protein